MDNSDCYVSKDTLSSDVPFLNTELEAIEYFQELVNQITLQKSTMQQFDSSLYCYYNGLITAYNLTIAVLKNMITLVELEETDEEHF